MAKSLIFLCMLLFAVKAYTQTATYNEFWTEITFTQQLSDKWATELNLENTFSSTEENNSPFTKMIEFMGRGFVHFYPTDRWKLSFFAAYIDNKDVPEIGQYHAPEYRIGPQAVYFFKRSEFRLMTRMRLEIRFIADEEGKFEDVYRYRQQFKWMGPIRLGFLPKDLLYGIVADELFFKSSSGATGNNFFDRNRITIGPGFNVTKKIQVELTYVNDYLPRPDEDEINHKISVSITFNNLFGHLENAQISPPNDIE